MRPVCTEVFLVQLENCPYDSTPIDAEGMSGGSLLISCSHCGAQWEWHNAWLHRITEPDKDAVRAKRNHLGPVHPD